MAGWEAVQTRTDTWRGTTDLYAREAVAKQKRLRWRGHPVDINLYLRCGSPFGRLEAGTRLPVSTSHHQAFMSVV